MGVSTFWDCQQIKSITIPGNVKEIPDWIFTNCTSLKDITLSHGVQKIGAIPFKNTGITALTLPESITVLDSLALSEIYHLDTLQVAWKKPLPIQANIFASTPMKHLRVPRGSAAAYRQAEVWKEFGDISEY